MSVIIYNAISVIVGVLLIVGLIAGVIWAKRSIQNNMKNTKQESNGGKK